MNKIIRFDKSAAAQLKNAFEYIKRDSPVNAQKVRKEIIEACKQLYKFPEKYPPDKYKIDNDGSFRAFTLYNYRISYEIQETGISILRIRHTSMEPLNY